MKKMLLLAGAMLALTAVAAFAAPGVNIAWTNCAVDGGLSNTNFTCTTNAAKGQLIFSWEPEQEVPVFNGAEAFVDIYFAGGAVPQWWGNGCTGKTVAVGIGVAAPGSAVECVDAWGGVGLGALAAYSMPLYIQHGVVTPGPANTAQVDAVGALAAGTEADITPGAEYYLFTITILGSKTAGTGACTGCSTAATLNAQGVWVTQPAPAPQQEIYTQGAHALCNINGGGVTSNESHTWGALKAMYR